MKRKHLITLRLFCEGIAIVFLALVFAAHNPVDIAMPIYTFATCCMLARCTGVIVGEMENLGDNKNA